MNRPTQQPTVGAAMAATADPDSPQGRAAARQPEVRGASLAIRPEQEYWTLRQLSALHATWACSCTTASGPASTRSPARFT